MKRILLTISLLTFTAHAQQAIVRDGEVVQTWRNSAPTKHRDYPGVFPFHSATTLPDGARLVPAVFATIPEGHRVTSESWSIVDGVAVQSVETEAIPVIIPDLTPRQIRLVMLSLGLTDDDIETLINNIEDVQQRAAALIEWRYASAYKRHHPLIDALAPQLGLTNEQLDQLFIQGSEL
jgi:hypothetical protein